MKVTIRSEKISKGRKSLYLDIYVNKDRQYQRRLKMYLIPAKSASDKERNKETMQLAEIIRNKEELRLLNKQHGRYDPRDSYNNNFVNYFDTLVKHRYETDINLHTWECTQKHLHRYSQKKLEFDGVTEMWMESFKAYLVTKVSKNSANGYFNILKHAIHKAFRDKLIDSDPAFNVKSPTYSNPKREFLTEDEIREIYKHECRYPVLKRAFLFSVLTGLRWSDIQNLVWKEIVQEDSQVFLVYTQRKTREAERLPIHSDALELLGERKDNEERVFIGLKYSAYHNVELQRWMMRAGVIKKITFHCARHTHACLLLNKGVDLFTVSKMLGHKDIKTTQIYAKLVNKTKEEAIRKLPSIFE